MAEASLLCKLIRAAGLLYVKDTPPGFLSQYLPSRSFMIAASLVCGLDKETRTKSSGFFLFLLFSSLLPFKSSQIRKARKSSNHAEVMVYSKFVTFPAFLSSKSYLKTAIQVI
jgi:hypothetical protein